MRRRPSRHPSDPGRVRLSRRVVAPRPRGDPPTVPPRVPSDASGPAPSRGRLTPRPDPSSPRRMAARARPAKELVDACQIHQRATQGRLQATLQVLCARAPRPGRSVGAREPSRVTSTTDASWSSTRTRTSARANPGDPKRPTQSGGRRRAQEGAPLRLRRYDDGEATNEQVHAGTALPHIAGVLRGTNATAAAYGATGSGKTHTMVGDATDPGLMVLSLRDIFRSTRATATRITTLCARTRGVQRVGARSAGAQLGRVGAS